MRRPTLTSSDTRHPVRVPGPAGVAAAIVVVTPLVCAVVAFVTGWVPSNDWAVVVARGFDTFSPHTPLVGQWSSLSSYVGYDVHQPGPIQFWLLGVPEHLFAPSTFGALVGQAIIATFAAAAFLVAVHRRGGARLVGPAAVVLMILFHSLGAEILRSPYNPSAAVLGLAAYLAAAWSLLCDDDVFWPVLLFAGSLSVQTHVTYLVPMGCIGLLVVIAAVVRRRRGESTVRSVRHRRAVLGASVAVMVLCWIGPLIDQIWGKGNLWRLIKAGTDTTSPVGPAFAVHRLIEQLGVWPRWIVGPWLNGPLHPSWWTWFSAVIIGMAIVGAVVHSARTGDRVRFRMGLVTVVALAGAFIGSARIPNEPLARFAPNNRLLWWPTAAFSWFFLLWTAAVIVHAWLDGKRLFGSARLHSRVLGSAALVVVLVFAGFLMRNGQARYDFVSITYGEVSTFSKLGAQRCQGRSEPIAVTGDTGANAGSLSGVVAMLRLHGCTVHTTNWQYFGVEHKVTGHERIELRILGTPVAPPGFRLIGEWDPDHPTQRWKGFRNTSLFVVSRHSYLYQRG